MNELALFAGAGGGILGGKLLGWRTICAVEIDPYCWELLLRRQRDGLLDVFPIWDDVRTFDGTDWCGAVDIVSAGFPCQPFSVAGRRQGEDDARNMWPDTIRIIRDVRPRLAFLENVPGLLSSGYFGRVLGDLAEAGYDARWIVLGADDVGANHHRKRLWILAYPAGSDARGRVKFSESEKSSHWQSTQLLSNPSGRSGETETGNNHKDVAYPAGRGWESWGAEQPGQLGKASPVGSGSLVADSRGERLERSEFFGTLKRAGDHFEQFFSNKIWWATEPAVGRVAYELAARMDFARTIIEGGI